MAHKKSSPKHNLHFSRPTIIFVVAVLAILIIAAVAMVQSSQNKALERKNSESFQLVETDINKLHTQLNMSAGAGEWSLDKKCDARTCDFVLKPLESDANAAVADLKSSITKAGSISSEDKKDDSSKEHIGFKLLNSKNECDAYFTKNKDQLATQVEISCTSSQ